MLQLKERFGVFPHDAVAFLPKIRYDIYCYFVEGDQCS